MTKTNIIQKVKDVIKEQVEKDRLDLSDDLSIEILAQKVHSLCREYYMSTEALEGRAKETRILAERGFRMGQNARHVAEQLIMNVHFYSDSKELVKFCEAAREALKEK